MAKMLTDRQAQAIKPGDKALAHGVKGLLLEPLATRGAGKWRFRYTSPITGKRRVMGLGGYPAVSLKEAGEKAHAALDLIAAGVDPLEVKEDSPAASGIPTFEALARETHAKLLPGWKNAKHGDQWINTLETYAFPLIGAKPVDTLMPKDFADVLHPIWLEKPETASRLKQRICTVMDTALAHQLVLANMASVVDRLLPKQPGKRERVTHQPAMPWRDIPAFVSSALRSARPDVTRPMLEFLILTGARSGEVREMTWGELDLAAGVWTIPAERMKAKQMHRVPLSDRAVEILQHQQQMASHPDLVFPAPRSGKAVCDMVLTSFLRRQNAPSSEAGRVATAHGFRSSFRDWASEQGYPKDLAERALAHTIANAVEAAYHRTDLLEQRRPMMQAWASHCLSVG